MLEHSTTLDETLMVGSYPQSPEQITYLKQECGVEAVVSLQSDDDLRTRGLRWEFLWQLYTQLGLVATRVPVIDFDARDLMRQLDEAVAAVAELVDAGHKTYVHCNAGMNRSPTVIIAYLVANRGMSVDDAFSWVTERHSCMPYPDLVRNWARARGFETS